MKPLQQVLLPLPRYQVIGKCGGSRGQLRKAT
jgi:hypothetical protein